MDYNDARERVEGAIRRLRAAALAADERLMFACVFFDYEEWAARNFKCHGLSVYEFTVEIDGVTFHESALNGGVYASVGNHYVPPSPGMMPYVTRFIEWAKADFIHTCQSNEAAYVIESAEGVWYDQRAAN